MDNEQQENVDFSALSSSERRKIQKPLVEKKRRDRINQNLEDLKKVLIESDPRLKSRSSKLDKADIIESALQRLNSEQNAESRSKVLIKAYEDGYMDCLNRTVRLLHQSCGGTNPYMAEVMRNALLQQLHEKQNPSVAFIPPPLSPVGMYGVDPRAFAGTSNVPSMPMQFVPLAPQCASQCVPPQFVSQFNMPYVGAVPGQCFPPSSYQPSTAVLGGKPDLSSRLTPYSRPSPLRDHNPRVAAPVSKSSRTKRMESVTSEEKSVSVSKNDENSLSKSPSAKRFRRDGTEAATQPRLG